MKKSRHEHLTKAEKKARKAALKEERKNETAGQKWKRRGKKILKVLLIILIVIVAIIVIMAISFEVKHATIPEAHESTAVRDGEVAAIAQLEENSTLAAASALDNPDGLYVSTTGVGWEQTTEDFSSQKEAWGGSYDGTEPFKIMGAYCVNCHTREELGLYRGTRAEAQTVVTSMINDFGCTQLTDAQSEVLIEFYTED